MVLAEFLFVLFAFLWTKTSSRQFSVFVFIFARDLSGQFRAGKLAHVSRSGSQSEHRIRFISSKGAASCKINYDIARIYFFNY